MKLLNALLLAIAAAAGLVILVVPAVAQDAAGTTINVGDLFSDVRGSIEAVAVAAVAAVLGWVSLLVKKNVGISIDAKYRDALQSAIVNGLHSGLDLAQARANEVNLDVKSELLAKALRYARTYAPGAIRHFKLSDRDLTEMARAQFAKLTPPEAPSAAAAEMVDAR